MDWVSLVSLIISMVGVILSLLLFNASVNNGRKIILQKILYDLTYNVAFMFSQDESEKIKVSGKMAFEKALIKVGYDLDQIKLCPTIGTPGIGLEKKRLPDGMTKETLFIKNLYDDVEKYLKKRNIINFKLSLESYDGRLYVSQHYSRILRYKRFLFIGPIYGVKMIYLRTHKYATYSNSKTKLIRRIANLSDLKRYYSKCFIHFGFVSKEKPLPFERPVTDIVRIVPKEEETPLVLYR